MNFEEKVKSMTAKEIIMSMVEGLKNPSVKVDFTTFGVDFYGVCYGGATTNTICKISGIVFGPDTIGSRYMRSSALKTRFEFFYKFENALDYLRCGDIYNYNQMAKEIGFAQIKKPRFKLPELDNDNYLDNLEPYIKLAEAQDGK